MIRMPKASNQRKCRADAPYPKQYVFPAIPNVTEDMFPDVPEGHPQDIFPVMVRDSPRDSPPENMEIRRRLAHGRRRYRVNPYPKQHLYPQVPTTTPYAYPEVPSFLPEDVFLDPEHLKMPDHSGPSTESPTGMINPYRQRYRTQPYPRRYVFPKVPAITDDMFPGIPPGQPIRAQGGSKRRGSKRTRISKRRTRGSKRRRG